MRLLLVLGRNSLQTLQKVNIYFMDSPVIREVLTLRTTFEAVLVHTKLYFENAVRNSVTIF